MTTKTISLAGKDVTLCYCYATEISFGILADMNINDFIADAVGELRKERMPDIRKTIFLIIASVRAYSEWKGVDDIITDKELMYDADPIDLGTAMGTILQLRADFYHIPSGEPEDESETTEEPKNA